MGGPSATIRKHYRRFARRAATACYGLVAGGMGVLLSFVVLQKLGQATNEYIALAGLAVAALGLATALPVSAFLAWAQRRRVPPLPVVQEAVMHGSVQGIVSSTAEAFVCSGGVSFELEGLRRGDLRRLEEQHTSETHLFESGAPARAKLWWLTLAACGVVSSVVLSVLGYTIDHLMPLAVYTSVFVASATALAVSARDLRIGIDGVRIGSEFVSYAALQQLTVEKGRVILVRRDGRRIASSVEVAPELGEALDALLQLRTDAKTTSDGEAYDMQNEESFEAWLQRIRGRFDATSFREAPASVDRAKELLRDAKVPFRVRVAVAVALSPIDPAYVGEALDGFVHPKSSDLQEVLALPLDAQGTRLRELVSESGH